METQLNEVSQWCKDFVLMFYVLLLWELYLENKGLGKQSYIFVFLASTWQNYFQQKIACLANLKKIITPHLLKIALQQSGNHTNVKMVQMDQFVKRLCIGSNLQSKISVCRITQISAFQTFFYLTFVLYVIWNIHNASNYIVCSNK